MRYRVKPGVVLFDLCGESFLFPSRSSGAKLGYLSTVPPTLAALLRQEPGAEEESLSEAERNKLQRMLKLGFIEACGL